MKAAIVTALPQILGSQHVACDASRTNLQLVACSVLRARMTGTSVLYTGGGVRNNVERTVCRLLRHISMYVIVSSY
jgi:hypothetical protein